jgi:hypothetical protein
MCPNEKILGLNPRFKPIFNPQNPNKVIIILNDLGCNTDHKNDKLTTRG